jgi:hypothetical protein
MILVLTQRHHGSTEFAPAMAESHGLLPGFPAVCGKPVHVAFDGGRLTSDGGVLLLGQIERSLGLASRLARCIEDPCDPAAVRYSIAEMIRYRALLIAAGYPDGNDCDALRADPAFKMAVGRLPESGHDLCSQPTMSRLENLPGPIALKRRMAAMVDLFCDSFEQVPARIVLDIDDTEDEAHGGQQLALFNAHDDSHCFLPIHVYEATTGARRIRSRRTSRTSCSKATANQFRLLVHTAAYWLMHSLLADAQPARPGAKDVVLARRPVRHHPPLAAQGRSPRH